MKAVLAEKRTAYGDEKVAALKIVTDGIAEAGKKAAVAEGVDEFRLMSLLKRKPTQERLKIDRKILVVDGNKMVAELENLELLEAAQEPIDPWYVAPKEVVKAAQEPTVPDVAPEVGGASRQQLRAM